MRILTAARALSTAARPFRVLGVQQVAVGSTDKHALRALWCDLLGVEKVHDASLMHEEQSEYCRHHEVHSIES